jgi:Lon protease-like protein
MNNLTFLIYLKIVMKLKLPNIIPIFPLSGVIYFPKTNLPLNIFEPRYLALINASLRTNKYLGLIQPKKNTSDVYSVGCLGKITENTQTKDGRLLINLIGITRFEIETEINNDKSYREFQVSYNKFKEDLDEKKEQLNRIEELPDKTKSFFKRNGLLLNWKEFEKLDQDQRINTLAMIAPISDEEKQTILESINVKSKTKILSEIIEFYSHNNGDNNQTIQ